MHFNYMYFVGADLMLVCWAQDVGAKDPDFGFLSGQFHVDLIVGDAIIVNPLMWHVADLKLSPPSSESKEGPITNHASLYKPKPEIKVNSLSFYFILLLSAQHSKCLHMCNPYFFNVFLIFLILCAAYVP